MRKKGLLIGICIVMLLGVTAGVYAAGDAGSESDPVVTKSYVDSKIADLKNSLSSSKGAAAADTFQATHIPSGTKLVGAEGTELILRSGSAAAVDNGIDGISDLTAGKDLKSGTAIVANHLLLVPRADGRGIYAKTELWVMIKGDYTLE